MIPTITSYFTKGSLYEEEVKDLILSCKSLEIEYEIEAIDSFGSWEKNCCFKPIFLLEKIKKIKKPLLWIDSDAIVLKKPNMENFLNCDVALRPSFNENKKVRTLNSGTIFLNYTKKTISLLEKWDEKCQKFLKNLNRRKEIWDQNLLYELIYIENFPIFLKELPIKYCYIFGRRLDKTLEEDPYILHFQASRLAKSFVNGNIEVPQFLKNLPPLELKKLRF